jgi:AraC-like DNA-binding protein
MLLMGSPCFCSVLILSYFGRILKASWWHRPTLIMWVSYAVMCLVALVTTLLPGVQMQGLFRSLYFLVAALLTAGYLIALVFTLIMVIHPLSRFTEGNFSNPDDVPDRYAKSLIYFPVLHLIMSWSVTFNGSYPVMAVGLLVLSVLQAIILRGALSPLRTVEAERLEEELSAPVPVTLPEEPDLPQERKSEILSLIRKEVEEGKAYLDSHFTLGKLSQACGCNRTYVSAILNEEYGGFFHYVNRCRLAHADAFLAEHPRADVDQVALEAGFNNRQSYYNARKRVREAS